MKRFFFVVGMMVALLLPGLALGDERAQEGRRSTGETIMDGLLQLGGQALDGYLDRKLGEKPAEPGPTGAADAPGEGEPRSWRERGSDMFRSFLQKSAEEMGEEPLGRWLAHALKQALDVLLNEYKEQYKAEGRAYAQELGDKMLERVREDPKISSSITSLQVLCWCVIAYLTLVTLIMLFCLLYLRRANGRLLAAVEEMGRRLAAK